MNQAGVVRPGSVTFVVVLIWISAVLEILAGVLLLVLAPAVRAAGEARLPVEALVALAVFSLVVGLITAAVAARLGQGGRGARMVVTVLEVLQLLGAVTSIMVVAHSATLSQSLGTVVVAVLVLVLLWNRQASAFFAGP